LRGRAASSILGNDRMRLNLASAALFGSASVVARAAEPPVQLAWNAPSGCPNADAVLTEVRRNLGAETPHRVVARADVTELGAERWSVHLVTEVDGVAGERSLEANSCASLASAAALILAWSVDPARGSAPERPEPAVSAPPTSGETSTHGSLGALAAGGAAIDVGMLPRAGGAGEVALGVLAGPIRAEIAGADWVTQDARRTSDGTHIHLLEGALRACWRGTIGARFELDPCLGLGWVHASSDGFGLTPNFQRTSDWGTGRAEALAVWTFAAPLALRASAGILVPFVRPPFVVRDAQGQELPLHRAAAVSGRAALGVEVHFP
jgi:hypothetical protein